MIDLLVAKYPACFFSVPQQRHPLKNGILEDLAKDPTLKDPRLVEAAVEWYRNHLAYRYAVAQRKPRIDLDGKQVAKITDAEAEEQFIEIQRINRQRKISHDFSREAVVERKAAIRVPVALAPAAPKVPEELKPVFDAIDKRLAKAKAIAGEYEADPELGAQLLTTVLRSLMEAVQASIDQLTPPAETVTRTFIRRV
jgi:sRNA-binding protein